MDINTLGFELERRIIIFHKNTTLPDDSLLGYEGNPNDVVLNNTPGESLLYNCPSGSFFIDKSANPYDIYQKVVDTAGGELVKLGSSSGGGGLIPITDSTTITNITNEDNLINGTYQLSTSGLSSLNYYADTNYSYLFYDSKLVRTDVKLSLTYQNKINKLITGFVDNTDNYNKNIVITYDDAARTVTLNGDFKAFYRGIEVPTLIDGYVSPAHNTDVTSAIYLTYNGVDINLRTTFNITELLISFIIANNSGILYCNRETHGTEDYRSHSNSHYSIGTYKLSGGQLSDYIVDSVIATERRPNISSVVLVDEDLHTLNSAFLGNSNNYTTCYLTDTTTISFDTLQTDFVKFNIANDRPYYNQYTGGLLQQTEVSNTEYVNYFLMAVPTTNDVFSRKYQYIFFQGQLSGKLSTVVSENVSNLNLGEFTQLASEFVFIAKLTIGRSGDNLFIDNITQLSGSKYSQISLSGSTGLTSVAVDEITISGNGTITNPLQLNTVEAGSAIVTVIGYNGLTKVAGKFDGGTTAPTNTDRLNYDGYLYATRFYGDGSQLTNLTFAAGTASVGAVAYNSTTKVAGKFDGGTTAPTNTTRLNYDGYLYATRFYGDGSQLASIPYPNYASGTASVGAVAYNSTTKVAGKFDGGTTAPTNTTRLNYDGYLYATRFYGDGSQLTSIPYPNYTVGTASVGAVSYNGTTKVAGRFDGGTTAPTNTTRLNYDGYFYATRFYGDGSQLTNLPASGSTITDDNATNTTQYLGMARITTGALDTAYTASTKLYFNPSTGTLNSTEFNALSDETKKTDITKIENSIHTVNELNGVEFNLKDNEKKSSGVIAQELEKILPHLVDTNEEGLKSVNYNGIIGYLIEAIKELNIRIELLEK